MNVQTIPATVRFDQRMTQAIERFRGGEISNLVFISEVFVSIKEFNLFMQSEIDNFMEISDPNTTQMNASKQYNSRVLNPTTNLAIVINESGEYPPNESSLRTIEGIRNMNDEQAKRYLEFYGVLDSVCRRTLLECVGINTKRLIDDKNYEARVKNSAVRTDEQQLTLFVNDTGAYPENGRLVNGSRMLLLRSLRNENSSHLDELLAFYDLNYDTLESFDEKLWILLSWLGYSTFDDELAENRLEISRNSISINEFRASLNRINQTVNEIRDSMNEFRNEIRDIKTDLTSLRTNVTSLGTNLTSLGTDVTSLRTDVTSLRTDVTSLGTNVTSLRTDVTSLGTNVTSLGTNVTSLRTEFDQKIESVKNELETKIEERYTESQRRTGSVRQLRNRSIWY